MVGWKDIATKGAIDEGCQSIWHIGLVEKDGYGYSGRIGEKAAEQCFKKEGRLILQGSLGGHVIPQATTWSSQNWNANPVTCGT
jgi:hypothetical protein